MKINNKLINMDFIDITYYNKIYKKHLTSLGKIRCNYCKYNRGENIKRKPKRNWKMYRKFQCKSIYVLKQSYYKDYIDG